MPHRRPKPPLKINTKPFKPSLLSLPPSPHSPRIPITPSPAPLQNKSTLTPAYQQSRTTSQSSTSRKVPPPSPPGFWTWTCHQCHRSYRLSATRRCLYDGHVFCSGRSVPRTWRSNSSSGKPRAKRHRACTSEFDYFGWSGWGVWRRNGEGSGPGDSKGGGDKKRGKEGKKGGDCWNQCDYPSHCLWGDKYGVAPTEEQREEEAVPKFYIDATSTSILEETESEKKTCQQEKKSEGGRKKKKRTHIPTPLSTITEEEEEEEENDEPPLDLLVDYIESLSKTCGNPSRTASPGIPDTPLPTSSPGTTSDSHVSPTTLVPPTKSSLRTLMNKTISRRGSYKRVCSSKRCEGEEVEIHGLDVDVDVDVDVDIDIDMFPPLEKVASHEGEYLLRP